MSLSVADSGSTCATLCSVTHVLWKNPHEPQNSTAAEQKCPSILPIHIQFPQSYMSEGRPWRLPPSFEATFLGIPALFVRCMYTICITITRTRSYHLASWTTNKTCVQFLFLRCAIRPWAPVGRYSILITLNACITRLQCLAYSIYVLLCFSVVCVRR